MADGFKLGDAFVEVEPDAATFEDKLRAEVEDTGLVVTIPVEPDTAGFQGKVDAAVSKSDATVTVPVTPDATGFAEKVEAETRTTGTMVSVPIEPDAEGFAAKVEAEVADTGAKAVVPLEPDGAGFAEKVDAEAAAAGEQAGSRFGETFSSTAGAAPLFTEAAGNVERDAEEAGEVSGSRFGGRFRSILDGLPLFGGSASAIERDAEEAGGVAGMGFGERFKSLLTGFPLLGGMMPGITAEAGAEGEAAGKNFSERMAAVLSGADLMEILLPAGLFAGVAYLATKFQTAMEMIVTQAGVAKSALGGLSSGVLDLAGQVGFSPDSLAAALYHIESSFSSVGITGSKAMELLRISAEGARVGGANLVDVTNALDATIAAGVGGVHNYSQAMGVLNAIVGAGDMSMEDLANAMGSGLMAAAKSYGQSIYQVGAALAVFGDNNIRGAKAATDLRMTMQAMLAPVSTAGDVLKKLGLTDTELGDTMEHHGLTAAIGELIDHLKASHVPIGEWGEYVTEIFGKKAGVGISVLMDQFDRLKSKFPDLERGAHGFESAWDKTKGTVGQELHELEGGFEALGVRIGTAVLPYLSQILKTLLTALPYVEKIGEWIGRYIGTPLVVVYNAINKVSDAFNKLLGFAGKKLFGGLVDGAKSLGKDIMSAFDKVEDYFEKLPWFDTIVKEFKKIEDYVSGIWDSLFSGGKGKASSIFGDILGPVERQFDAVKAFIVSSFDAWWKQHGQEVKEVWNVIWEAIKDTVVVAWRVITTLIKVAWPAIEAILKVGMAAIVLVFKTGWDVIAAAVKIAWAAIELVVKVAWDVIVGLFDVALDLLTGKWGKAWDDIKQTGEQVWNAISQFFSTTLSAISALFIQVWNNIKDFLASTWNAIFDVLKSVWNAIWTWVKDWWATFTTTVKDYAGNVVNALKTAWDDVWADVKSVWGSIESWFKTWWDNITSWITTTVGTFRTDLMDKWKDIQADAKSAWNALEAIFKAPVNFLINTVYDNGIKRLWNDVVNAVGANSLDLPNVPSLAEGGKITQGTGPKSDDVLARVSKGETVVSAADSKVLAPAFSALGIPGYAAGGKVGDGGQKVTLAKATQVMGLLSGASGGAAAPASVIGDAGDIAKLVLAISTGNQAAFSSDFAKMAGITSGGGASGGMATAMTDMPTKLVADVVKATWGALVNAQSVEGGGTATGTAKDIINYAQGFVGKSPYVWGGTSPAGWDCSGMVEFVYDHFGLRPPRTSEEQATWVKRTNKPTPGGLAFFAGSDGTDSSPGHVGIVTGPNSMINAADEQLGTIDSSLGGMLWTGIPPGGFPKPTNTPKTMDQGGYLMPGRTMVTNNTGLPERVVAPHQEGAQGANVTVNFYGTQYPNPEQVAALKMELATAVGVAG